MEPTFGWRGVPSMAERTEARLASLNDCDIETAFWRFHRCCGSQRWANQMAKARPFSTVEALEDCAGRIWAACSREDRLEAFAAHPRIGEHGNSRWSQSEQSGVVGVSANMQETLAHANREYEAKFGYRYIICATGKNAEELLFSLKQRLQNDPQTEIDIAAEQHHRITRLRLKKLLTE